MVFYFLSLAICLFVVKLVLYIIPIYHRDILISIYSLFMTSDSSNCAGFCRSSSLWHLNLNCSIYCLLCLLQGSFFFQSVVFSVIDKIWRVMIPCVCILYSNANIQDNALILGEHSFLFRTLFYLSIFDPFNWHLILYLMFWYLQLVLIGI